MGLGNPGFPKLRGADGQASQTQDNIAQQLQPISTALAKTPIMGAAPPPWIKPNLLNGIANVPAPNAAAGFHRDALGYVHSKGLVAHAAGAVAGTVVMIFPPGYRPSELLTLVIERNGAVGGLVTVAPTGIVTFVFSMGVGLANGLFFSFLAEQ